MNYSQLKNAIVEVIRTNGNEEITGEVLQYTLLEMVSMLGKDYQFAGVGTPLTDTTERDDNVAWILGRGTYENFGNPFTVAVDEIAVVKYDGTFTVEKIKTGVVVDSELTLAGTNPVEGGAIAREFAKMRAAGYFFAGIMTPTGTPPHEITEKIFYLCTQAGVYPNFDSIVLDRGLNILKWNGSRWSADLVFAITDDVTEGLASLLTSAGAYAAIAAEAQLRQEGDAAVQQNIDAVEALIPSQASTDNKLVDEQKMNSSIATATATYRGAYNQVSNLNLGVDATYEQVALALASKMTYLHITPDNNDYCYVLVPTSAETPTEIAHIDRYKYNGTAWGYEYTLNNSGYTAAQWAAINSGITSGLVAKLGALPTAEELAAALLTKQDKLTFDTAPTPSSTNPVTSGGVYTAIDDEKGARVNADAALQQAIEAILALIPSAATALNQLADKAFVNSSIATATATFRGTFNLVSDLQLTVDATHADIAAALLNAISGADNNDYAFVQIPTSVDTPTEIRVTERYKFNGTAWQYEYDLNNSGFTAAQWEAINSGITALLVTKLSNLPNATELATLFAGKQNVLTFDNAPVQGSNNPVKSGGLYDLFAAIDAKMPTGASANNKLVAEDRLAAYVGGIIGALDATFNLTSTDGHVTLRMTQTDGVITSLQILTSDIASASALATLGGQVSTNADDIAALQALYNALQQSAPQVIEPTDTWPVASPSDTVIYRVIDRVNTPPQYYSDYMWNGTAMVLMATYNNAIDDVPTAGSNNLVKSGGVAKSIEGVLYEEMDGKLSKNLIDLNTGWTDGYVNTLTGEVNSHSELAASDPIPVKGGAKIIFNSYYNGLMTEGMALAILDSSNTVIYDTQTPPYFSSLQHIDGLIYTLELPTNAAYIRINELKTEKSNSFIKYVYDSNSKITLDWLQLLSSQIPEILPNKIYNDGFIFSFETYIVQNYTEGGYINNTSFPTIDIVQNADIHSAIIPCQDGDVLVVKNGQYVLPTDTTMTRYYYAFGSINDPFVSVIPNAEIQNYVSVFNETEQTFEVKVPKGCGYFLLTMADQYRANDNVKFCVVKRNLKWLEVTKENIPSITSIVNEAEETIEAEYHLWDSICKEIEFNGKTIKFFGDSITAGTCSPNLGDAGNDSWPNTFARLVGATPEIHAYGGTCITDTEQGEQYNIGTVIKQNVHSTDEIIIIAGGTNDFGTGKSVGAFGDTQRTTFFGSMNDICSYIQTTAPNAVVIFITPIPRTRPESSYPHVASLNAYRSAIYDVATKYGYNVVDGNSLGMPRMRGGWNNFMCDDNDGIHPTVEGHKLMARNITGKLL